MEAVRIQLNPFALPTPHLLHVFLQQCHVFHHDNLPVLLQLQQVEHLQSGGNVVGIHPRVLTDASNTQLGRVGTVEVLHDGALPVAVIADASQIRERFLGRTRLTLHTGEKVAEVDQETTIALSLILRHCHDTRNIILLLTRLLL